MAQMLARPPQWPPAPVLLPFPPGRWCELTRLSECASNLALRCGSNITVTPTMLLAHFALLVPPAPIHQCINKNARSFRYIVDTREDLLMYTAPIFPGRVMNDLGIPFSFKVPKENIPDILVTEDWACDVLTAISQGVHAVRVSINGIVYGIRPNTNGDLHVLLPRSR